MNTLSATIKKRRKELGYTLAQIAEAVGVSEATVQRWESGNIKTVRHENLDRLAEVLRVPPPALMGWDIDGTDAAVVTVNEPYFAPIVGTIPAGYPAVALEDIEGYEPIPYPDAENYFFLRVDGNSMINAGILPGDLVLIKKQDYAEPGQIVACRVNGDEATLKRYKPSAGAVVLMSENSEYEPQVISTEDFVNGYAGIIGVAKQVRHNL